ncbi:MAG: alpha/beta hydrolase [Solirubrobacterales bacterium]
MRRFIAVGAFALIALVVVFVLLGGGTDEIAHPKRILALNHGVAHERITIDSKAVGRKLPADVLLPPDYKESDHRPILVFLHGRSDSDTPPGNIAGGKMPDALKAAGPKAPIVVAPWGGSSYWHNRSTGDWASYVNREVINAVARKYNGDRRRVAIAGHSMGGFGALNLARLHPGRFCAAGGHSPALWQTGGETAAGAFDGAGDFTQNDVIAVARSNPAAFKGTRIWIDAGDQDPFQPGDKAMIAALQAGGVDLTTHSWPGAHTGEYTNAHMTTYFRFYARALARCRR